MLRQLSIFICIYFTLLSFAHSQLKIQFPVEKIVLDNGLTVILYEDHSVPMVSYHTWYRVGSKDEKPGVTGAAHMLEHMMFKGAKKYSGKQFDQILHANGITNNAFTSNDYTGFYQNLPSSKLELMMDMEVDRMSSLLIQPEDLKSELQVVGEERRWRLDDSPTGTLQEALMGLVFSKSSYRWPVIGTMNDIQAYTSESLRFFYETYYVPNNAVLVLAGDFNTKDVKKMLQKHYGKLVKKELPQNPVVKEPVQTVQKNKIIRKNLQNVSFVLAYQGVPAGHPDSYALDLVATLLTSGPSSRMHKKMVYQKQQATSVSAYNMTLMNEGLLQVFVSLKPGIDSAEPINDAYNEVWKLRNQKISESELKKVKTVFLKEYVDGLVSIDAKARGLAVNEILFGDYTRLFTDIEKYQAVTIEDILNVSKKYLNQTQRSIVELKPKN